jgi:undecaprenyl-diphosphatase
MCCHGIAPSVSVKYRLKTAPMRWASESSARSLEQRAFLTPARALIVVCCLAALWLAMLLGHGGYADRFLLMHLHASGNSPIVPVARAVAPLGSWAGLEVALCAAALLLLLRHRRPWLAILLVTVSYAGHLLFDYQQLHLAQPRPDPTLWLAHVETASFPSGHAAQSMLVYLTIALMLTRAASEYRWLIALALSVSLLLGLSRTILGVHWPSDVIGGWSFGAAWAVLSCSAAIAFENLMRSGAAGVRPHPS